MRIAFYAPLKGPDHPVPSGDRQMARLILEALRTGGHTVEVASTLRSFLAAPDAARQAEVERWAEAESDAVAQGWRAAGRGGPPDLWFTYHPFYKAPDLLGVGLSQRFAIPYVTAEASHARKRATGLWAGWHAATEAALRHGRVHFCLTEVDRAGLEELLGPDASLVRLPPFIDAAEFRPPRRSSHEARACELVTVAMMRHGDKLRSFAFLADALRRLPASLDWHLSIVGDGPARPEVEAAFATLTDDRVSFLGERPPGTIGAVLAGADLYVWPGFNEAYGVSYLEAGAAGLPVLAMRCGGIASVVVDRETGILVPEGDLEAYARHLVRLITDAAWRERLGQAAAAFVPAERTVARAAAILDAGLAMARVER